MAPAIACARAGEPGRQPLLPKPGPNQQRRELFKTLCVVYFCSGQLVCYYSGLYTLLSHWNYSPGNKPFVVNFLYDYSFPKRINMKRLIELGIISDVQLKSRSLPCITPPILAGSLRTSSSPIPCLFMKRQQALTAQGAAPDRLQPTLVPRCTLALPAAGELSRYVGALCLTKSKVIQCCLWKSLLSVKAYSIL